MRRNSDFARSCTAVIAKRSLRGQPHGHPSAEHRKNGRASGDTTSMTSTTPWGGNATGKNTSETHGGESASLPADNSKGGGQLRGVGGGKRIGFRQQRQRQSGSAQREPCPAQGSEKLRAGSVQQRVGGNCCAT